MDKAAVVATADEPPLTKSTDSDACVDEIECFPKQYDCRNNPIVADSYSKFEEEMIAIHMKELETKNVTVEQQQKLIQQQTQMTQEQYNNKLAITKLMIRQMNHHHHLQEQKYMHEIHSLRELFNLSEQQWKGRMNTMDEQLRQQQMNHAEIISELRNEVQQYNAQNQIFAAESKKTADDFEMARLELNELIESNQTIIHSLETKIDKQSNDLFAIRADTSAEKEEMELMVQSWMTQCEVLQQQVQDFQLDLTSAKTGIKDTSTMQDEIKASVEKMGQTYENVIEHVMEQIQEQSELQNTNYNHFQETQNKLQQVLEELDLTTKEKFGQIETNTTIHAGKMGSLDELYEKVNGTLVTLNQSLTTTDGHVADLKESMTAHTTTQAKIQVDVTGLQSIVAKLADASNNRFVRMESTFEGEINSVKDIKKEMLAALDANQERAKMIDSKIVIHSIQLGEISKEMKNMDTDISVMKDQHQSTQNECIELSSKIEIQNESQRLVNENVTKSITSLQSSSKDVEVRTSTIEKCIDTMTTRMDQFHADHSTTRGNFLEQHQNMETTVTDQLKVLAQQIDAIQKSTHVDIRNVADTLDKQIKVHQRKIEEYEAMLKILSAHSESTIHKHESIDANLSLLQAGISDTKQCIQKVDQEITLQLNEHITYAKSQLQHITDDVIPQQQESNNLLRARFVAMEGTVRDKQEKTSKETLARFDQLNENFATMNNTIDEICTAQEGTSTDFLEMKQSIEKLESDLGAVNESYSLEMARRSELQTKLCEIESSVEQQSAKAIEIEAALDSHVTETCKNQERLNMELNRSLTQVLSLSHMKEAMMKQITDCLTNLTVLDASKAEHAKKLTDLSMEMADHDAKIQTMSEENISKLRKTEDTLESYRVALDALKLDVQKQREVQKGVNDFVSESVASCTVSISAIDKRAISFDSQLDDIASNLLNHIKSSDEQMTKVLSSLEQMDDNRKNIELKLNESDLSMRDYQAKISQDTTKLQSFANDLKSTIDRHSDRLKTAKDARVVIRNDLKTLVDSMNEQFENVRSQVTEGKEKLSKYSESMMQTREELLAQIRDEPIGRGVDDDSLTKLEFLAGRVKLISENSKSVQEKVAALQDEFEQWKKNIDERMTIQINEVATKMEYTTGKFKATSDKTKQNHESIVEMQNTIAMYKSDQDHIEKTTELIEGIATKLDFLAGKLKTLNEQSKSTTVTIQTLENEVSQINKRQSEQQEQLKVELNEHEQVLTSAMASTISDAVNESVDDLQKEFKALNVAFEEVKAQRQLQREIPPQIIEDMRKEIDTMTQQLQAIELEQRAMKGTPPPLETALLPTTSAALVNQLKTDVDQLTFRVEQNANEINKTKAANEILANEVHGIQNRGEKYKKAMMKQHGQLKEFVSVTPTVKRTTGSHKVTVSASYHDSEAEEFHEARDSEDVHYSSSQIDHRDPE